VDSGGEELEVSAGHCVLLLAGVREHFSFSADGPTHPSWIHAPRLPDPFPIPGRGGSQRPLAVLRCSARLFWLLSQLLETGRPGSRVRDCLCQDLAEAALYEYCLLSGWDLEADRPRHPGVEKAIRFMENRYREGLDLAALSRAAGLSPQHLTRLFREETRTTPMRYLYRIREDHALRLLRETGLTIAEIAAACGFQNPFHLTRRMSARFGSPPRLLRQRSWREDLPGNRTG